MHDMKKVDAAFAEFGRKMAEHIVLQRQHNRRQRRLAQLGLQLANVILHSPAVPGVVTPAIENVVSRIREESEYHSAFTEKDLLDAIGQ